MTPSPLPAGVRSFVDFGRLLHHDGFPITTEQTIAFLKSITLLGPKSIGDVYWAARACLAPAPDRVGEFDALFDAFFRGATGSIPVSDASADEESTAGESDSSPIDPVIAERANESGAAATAAEALSLKRFSQHSASERLRAMQRTLAARAPRRRGYRHVAVNAGEQLDLRRSLSRMVRGGSGMATPAWTRRREKLRRVLLLVDISGSMKSHTEDYLRFAHALTQTLPSVETFSFGTRLTRLTRSLRHKDLARALAEIAPSVADWDGGTRIAESLGAFLSIPRFSRASRGALVIVLSDGLERGDAEPMAHMRPPTCGALVAPRLADAARRRPGLPPGDGRPEGDLADCRSSRRRQRHRAARRLRPGLRQPWPCRARGRPRRQSEPFPSDLEPDRCHARDRLPSSFPASRPICRTVSAGRRRSARP